MLSVKVSGPRPPVSIVSLAENVVLAIVFEAARALFPAVSKTQRSKSAFVSHVSVARTSGAGFAPFFFFFFHFFFLEELAFFFLHFFFFLAISAAPPPAAVAAVPSVTLSMSARIASSASPVSPLFLRIPSMPPQPN